MRDAEDRVAAGESGSLLWRRKSALPWVVMGMGGWSTEVGELRHLMWLYRLGCFLGRIDDAADVERDNAQGRLNTFAGLDNGQVLAIARNGRNLLRWWDKRCRDADTRSAFLYCVNSWIDSRPK
jgi:hypothetical protein